MSYIITVQDAVTGGAIAGATVTLHNFTQAGAAAPPVSQTTGPNGQTPPFTIALHTKSTVIVTSGGTNREGKPEREPERAGAEVPTISVRANGYVDLKRPLF